MNTVNIPYVKKLQTIAYNFVKICTNNPPKINKRLSKNYWRVYNFLYNTDNIQPKIQALYEYSLELEKRTPKDTKRFMTLTQFIQNAEKWRLHLLNQAEKAKIDEIKKKSDNFVYNDFSLTDLENL